MKAVILAAGVGSRLLPYTNTIPKCLLKVRGHSILEYQVATLKKCGIDDIVIVIGHCGDRIKESVTIPVTFIENQDYKTTNSSYSLWLAKSFIKEGFIYINSDLIFHPKTLQLLLDSPARNAIIIDKKTKSDMHKAEIKNNIITRMEKYLPEGRSHADVVGPAKFSEQGAKKIINILDTAISGGERNQWCYKIFGDFAKSYPLSGIKNHGHYWAEIDTPQDLRKSHKTMPEHLVSLLL